MYKSSIYRYKSILYVLYIIKFAYLFTIGNIQVPVLMSVFRFNTAVFMIQDIPPIVYW